MKMKMLLLFLDFPQSTSKKSFCSRAREYHLFQRHNEIRSMHAFNMPVQIVSASKNLALIFAQMATPKFFSNVRSLMLFQTGLISKPLFARIALVRFFTCVNFFMSNHIFLHCKCFLTIRTLVGLFTCVNAFMFNHVNLLTEGSLAKTTFEGLFTCVNS